MRAYPSRVVGVSHEGRAEYIAQSVFEGDALTLVREPQNPHDPDAVSVSHKGRKIGYIPRTSQWVARSLDEGDTHEVQVQEFILDDNDALVGLSILITITKDGDAPAPVTIVQPVPPKEPAAPERPAKPRASGGCLPMALAAIVIVIGLFVLVPAPVNKPIADFCKTKPTEWKGILPSWQANGVITALEPGRVTVEDRLWEGITHQAKVSIGLAAYCSDANSQGRATVFIRGNRDGKIRASVSDGHYSAY
jgi:hypothetical protein